jgi:hypothetical protein
MRVATRNDQTLPDAERVAVNGVIAALEHLLSLRPATKQSNIEFRATGVAGRVDQISVQPESNHTWQ